QECEPDRHRHEQEVVDARRRELQAREIQLRHGWSPLPVVTSASMGVVGRRGPSRTRNVRPVRPSSPGLGETRPFHVNIRGTSARSDGSVAARTTMRSGWREEREMDATGSDDTTNAAVPDDAALVEQARDVLDGNWTGHSTIPAP